MENNKREWPPVRPRRRGINIRPVAMVLALVLLVGAAVGGTIAWFIDVTPAKTNTFTVGNIDIDLTETKSDFKMVPGCTIEKDPVVTVKKGSEDAWIFIKVEESGNLDDFIAYEVDGNNWTALPGESGVFYAKYANRHDVDVSIKVLLDQKVTVKDTVTKEMMDALTDVTRPTLTFTAYAVQYWETNGDYFEPAEAWAKISTP